MAHVATSSPRHMPIEVDFADKWGEAIGQILNYAFQSNKRAGILLIIEHEDDEKHLIRVNSIIKHFDLPIDVLASVRGTTFPF